MATPSGGVPEILSTLIACLCEKLALSTGGAPAQCCLISSPAVIASCCAGFAWVRPVGSFPTDVFPAQAYTPTRCLPPTWGLSVELGVARCAPTSCDQQGNPCCEKEATAVTVALSDFDAMKKAVLCCLPAATGLLLDEIEIGPWVVGGSEGGCFASTMTATIRYTDNCAC